MENFIKNKKLIAIILIVIVIIVVVIVKNTNKSGEGYSVNRNDTLQIDEYNLSIKVNAIDDAVYFSNLFADENTAFTGVKLSITNNSDEDFNIITYNFALLDSSNTDLASVSTGFQNFNVTESVNESELLSSNIPAGQTVSGYLYFQTDSKDIKKLKVACPTKNKTDNKSIVAGQEVYFEYYYINL